jgi:hypothetical protein
LFCDVDCEPVLPDVALDDPLDEEPPLDDLPLPPFEVPVTCVTVVFVSFVTPVLA